MSVVDFDQTDTRSTSGKLGTAPFGRFYQQGTRKMTIVLIRHDVVRHRLKSCPQDLSWSTAVSIDYNENSKGSYSGVENEVLEPVISSPSRIQVFDIYICRASDHAEDPGRTAICMILLCFLSRQQKNGC